MDLEIKSPELNRVHITRLLKALYYADKVAEFKLINKNLTNHSIMCITFIITT